MRTHKRIHRVAANPDAHRRSAATLPCTRPQPLMSMTSAAGPGDSSTATIGE
jgi:hypothetical protein